MSKSNTDFQVEAAEESPGFLLWQVTTRWQRGIKKALDAIDLTHPQFVLLASLLWLSRQQKNITQIDLSQHSLVDPMTTSGIVKILERKGWVERRAHETDTRAKTVLLTADGAKIARKAVKIIEQFDQAFFAALGNKIPAFNTALLRLLRGEQ